MTGSEKPIIVSGGSRGLGFAIVDHCLKQGHVIGTFARNITEPLSALTRKYPETLLFGMFDGTDRPKVENFVETFTKRFGTPRGLVNNAAVGQDHLLANMAPDTIERIIAVNLAGPIFLTRCVLRKMLMNSQGGRVVNISSICATRGYAGLSVYSATKGAIESFTRSLAQEVGSRSILVNAIAPGFFDSEMSSVLSKNQRAAVQRRTPTGRLCTERDILPVLDLLLFAPINVTGTVVNVDGGGSL